MMNAYGTHTRARNAGARTHAGTHTRTHARTHTHTHTRARAHTHTRSHARARARTRTHTHARARARARTHTHIPRKVLDQNLSLFWWVLLCLIFQNSAGKKIRDSLLILCLTPNPMIIINQKEQHRRYCRYASLSTRTSHAHSASRHHFAILPAHMIVRSCRHLRVRLTRRDLRTRKRNKRIDRRAIKISFFSPV